MASIIQNDDQTKALATIQHYLAEVDQINILLAATGSLKLSAEKLKKEYVVVDKTCKEQIQKILLKRKLKLKKSIEDLAKKQRILLSSEDNEALKVEEEQQETQTAETYPTPISNSNDFYDEQDDSDNIIEIEFAKEQGGDTFH